jgi:hypothetical protein
MKTKVIARVIAEGISLRYWTMQDGTQVPLVSLKDTQVCRYFNLINANIVYRGMPEVQKAWKLVLKKELARRDAERKTLKAEKEKQELLKCTS